MVERFDQLKDKVEKIAFTDSGHSLAIARQGQDLTQKRKQDITEWFSEVITKQLMGVINYRKSEIFAV